MKYAALILFSLTIALTACNKDEVKKTDTDIPVINLTSPAANTSMVANNSAMQIIATITDNEPIKEIHVRLQNVTAGATNADLLHYVIEPEGNSAVIDTSYTFSVSTHSDFKLRIEATDIIGNTALTERNFHIMP